MAIKSKPNNATYRNTPGGHREIVHYLKRLINVTKSFTGQGNSSFTGVSTEAKQDSTITTLNNLLTELQDKADLTEVQPVNQVLGTTSNKNMVDSSGITVNTSFTLMAANANRKQVIIHNDSTIKLYVSIGSAANITGGTEDFSFALAPNATYVLNSTTEVINGVSGAVGTGFIAVTETT